MSDMVVNGLKIPEQVAIIMDGNGRWAKSKGMPRNYGHIQGAKMVEVVCRAAHEMGIKYLTVYAFSTENWNRPQDEVNALMKLLGEYIKTCMKTAKRDNMRVRFIGDKSGLSEELQKEVAKLEEYSAPFDGLQFQIALNYGGRDEIRRAVKELSVDVAEGKIKPEDITEDMISDRLDTAGIPDPDLMIRTCNELRISNFLLWQLAYAEMYFTEVAWPEFDGNELKKAVEAYTKRDRRFGLVKEP